MEDQQHGDGWLDCAGRVLLGPVLCPGSLSVAVVFPSDWEPVSLLPGIRLRAPE